ncbi:MAG: hypothetical protein J6S66_00530 [Bacteroidales bacterium]|nr:hypothetical protein [Bacteroidales bacterium]
MVISTFIGDCVAKIDDKGRVVFPSSLKAQVPEECGMKFVLHKDIYRRCLEMYTFEEWQAQAESIKSKLDLIFNPDHADFWSKYMEDSAIVVPDPKLGRLSIPRNLQEGAGLTKEVMFAGKGYKIEIWDKETYEASRMSNDRYRALAKELSQQR